MPDRISGTVEIIVVLIDEADGNAQALADLVSNWVRAVELGFFGPGWIRLQGEIATQGRRITGRLEGKHVPQAAFHVLWRMIRCFSKVKDKVEIFNVSHEGQPLEATRRVEIPALPQSIPFVVEYPEDLKRYLRVEIEFRAPLAPSERDVIIHGLFIWDALVAALAEEEWWGRRSDHESRMLSPAIIEHQVNGYYAGFECLHFIVWFGLRLHQRLTIERLTME